MEGQKKTDGGQKSRAAFIRLLASLVILGMALLLRAFFPDQTRDFLQKTVTGGIDYVVLLGEVGGSLRAFVLGVPYPEELGPPQTASGPDGEKEDFSSPREEEDVAFEPEETYDPEKEPPPEDIGGLGGFEPPILWADARFLLSQFDGEDDTLPLPFGMQKPDRVDYTEHELPFETAPPAEGRLSSPFGYRVHPVYGDWRFHYGIDIANKSGTPICAFADGTVAAVGKSAGYGNYLIIGHSGGYVSLYAHCKAVAVEEGQEVKLGQEVAAVGSTGVTTGPHLHFELRSGNAFLDPAAYAGV